jgi:hypothetical protein
LDRHRLRLTLTISAAIAIAIAMLPGGSVMADHNADVHSDNMVYEGTSVNNGITNSDLAFWGDRAYTGDYGGFRIIDISDPTDIENPANVITDFSCPGPQNDISVWDGDGNGSPDLLFLSVDSPRSDDTCASTGVTASTPGNWEGVRIFDISNETAPVLLESVPTDCGSHTHTLIPSDAAVEGDGNLYIYVSSYPLGSGAVTNGVPKEDGTECEEPEPGITGKVHNKISIIEVPESAPTDTTVKEVALPINGEMSHVQIGSRSFDFTACHDIAAFLALDRAVGACWKEGIFWDISDPFNPLFLRRVRAPEKVDTLYHSITFTWDGKVVAFEDEAGGGGDARCKLEDGKPDSQGAMYFHTMNGDFLGEFKIPMHITTPCTAHNYTVVPVTDGRYILASAWYTGGTWMVDFTNPADAKAAGHYIAHTAPNGVGDPISSDVWSSYWYNGYVFANDGLQRGDANGERGLDVFSYNSPKVATAIDLPFLNAQTQMDLIPQTPVVPKCFGLPVTIEGTNGPDVISGTGGTDVILARAGDDVVNARGGNDYVCAGGGGDLVRGRNGHDRMKGNAGSDELRGGDGNDNHLGGPGVDKCVGGSGTDKGKSCEFEQGIP